MNKRKLPTTIGILVGLDLVSKYVFYDLKYLEHSFFVTPAFNTGISRSLPLPYLLIILVSCIGIGAIVRLYSKKKIGRIITGMLLSGTIGNFIDRVIYGGVRDFIDIQLFNFPIFNFADIMLTLWVWFRIYQVILEKRK